MLLLILPQTELDILISQLTLYFGTGGNCNPNFQGFWQLVRHYLCHLRCPTEVVIFISICYQLFLDPWGYLGSAKVRILAVMMFQKLLIQRVSRQILPASAISKVIFPTKEELHRLLPLEAIWTGQGFPHIMKYVIPNCCAFTESTSTASNGPKLPSSPSRRTDLGNITDPTYTSSPLSSQDPTAAFSQAINADIPKPSFTPPPRVSSRFSSISPFFGYPITVPHRHPPHSTHLSHSPSGIPQLRHGRRRKRDLARALLVLFWQKWKARIGILVLVLCVVSGFMRASRSRRIGGLRLNLSRLLMRNR